MSNTDGRGPRGMLSGSGVFSCGPHTGRLPTDVTKANIGSSKVTGASGGALIHDRHISIAKLACSRFLLSSELTACNSSTWFQRASRSPPIRSQSCCSWPAHVSVSSEPLEAVFWELGSIGGDGALASSSCCRSLPFSSCNSLI